MNTAKSIFEELFEINVNNYIEKKKDLSYLSWPYAWAAVKKKFPEANYKIYQFGEKQLPYVFDENVGYMTFTDVTINGLTHTMWLPVMDSANKTMKSKSYTYDTKFKKDIPVEAASMFDINKTIMRCLVKNLAMFGLGLYIYAGEDLPEVEIEKIDINEQKKLKELINNYEDSEKVKVGILNTYKIKNLNELSKKQYQDLVERINNYKKEGDKNGS